MVSYNDEVLAVGSALIVIFLASYYVVRRWRQRRLQAIESPDAYSPRPDRAHNQIVTGRAFAAKLESDGVDVARSRELLDEAERDLKRGEVDLALANAKAARDELQRQRAAAGPKDSGAGLPRTIKAAEPARPSFRDVSRRVGDKEPEEAPSAPVARSVPADPSDGSKGEEPSSDVDRDGAEDGTSAKTVPKNYLESRFQLKLVQEELAKAAAAKPDAPEVKEARKFLDQAQQCFDRKDFTESLRLALRSRRRLGSAEGDTVPLSPGTVIEAPPEEPSLAALRSSAPSSQAVPDASGGAKPTTVTCARCHRSNPAENRFCRGCGAPLAAPTCPRCHKPVAPDDGFCGACGAPIATT